MIINLQQLCGLDVGDCGVWWMDVSGCGIWWRCLWGLRNVCVSGEGYKVNNRFYH
jgi:hypothetical protein